MLKSFFTSLFRQLWRNRLFTVLNIVGLSVSICIAWIIFRMVSYEYSFDKKIPDVENIYQVVCKNKSESSPEEGGFAGIPQPLVNTLRNEVSGVNLIVPMFYKYYNNEVTVKEENGKEQTIINDENTPIVNTLSDYFDMFNYTWLAGNKKDALSAPDKIVLTESLARKYFHSLKPVDMLGKTIVYNDTLLYRVSGVVADLDYPNTFYKYNNAFMQMKENDLLSTNWGGMSSNDLLFIKPIKQQNVNTILKKASEIWKQRNKEAFETYKYISWFEALPMVEKHFSTRYAQQTRTANKTVLNGLMITGAFLLLLACINYINLSTAMLPARAKEIGIRKTLGSSVGNLVSRFMAETLVITAMAALISFLLAFLGIKLFADFIPDGMQDYLNYPEMVLFLLVLIVLITIFSGLYPAWVSAKVNTLNVLKGVTEKSIGHNKLTLRKSLIVFQFIVAQAFIISAIIVGVQLQYSLHKDLGFNKNAVITIDIPEKILQQDIYKDKQFALLDALKKNAVVRDVALGSRPMDNSMWGNVYQYIKDTTPVQSQLNMKFGDENYISFYGFKLLAGRNFRQTDTASEFVINESAVKAFGFKHPQDAIGKALIVPYSKESFHIVGVINDFHQFGIQSKIDPAVIMAGKEQLTTLNIRLPMESSKWRSALKMIENEWNKVYAGQLFNYKFYDEFVGEFYMYEQRMQRLVRTATAITILISCLGLFGLATLMAFQRTKEVGIRKVLGASVSGIVQLLSKDFVKLVIISLLIATPVAWWLMNKWLQNYAYRVEIQWWMFALAGVGAILIALITVSYQSIKAATANPVKSLRNE